MKVIKIELGKNGAGTRVSVNPREISTCSEPAAGKVQLNMTNGDTVVFEGNYDNVVSVWEHAIHEDSR